MYLAGRQTRRHADRILVWQLDVRKLQIPVVLSSIDDHSQNVSHSVVHLLSASVTVRIIGGCGKLAHSQQLVDSCKNLEQKSRPLSESMARGHPRRGMYWLTRMLTVPSAVKLGGSDGKHIGPTTETVGDEQHASVASRRNAKIDELVDTDGDANLPGEAWR